MAKDQLSVQFDRVTREWLQAQAFARSTPAERVPVSRVVRDLVEAARLASQDEAAS